MVSERVTPAKEFVFGAALKIAAVLAVLASAACAFWGRWKDAAGMWAALGWIAVNAWLLGRILEDVAAGKAPDRRKIFGVLIVKFPVLYLAGFFALAARWVSLEGAAAAFTVYLAAVAFCAARSKFGNKK